MTSDNQIVFGRFPGIYSLNKNEIPVTYFDVDASLYRIRAVANKQILLLGDHTCRLVSQSGKIIREWNNIINDKVENAALNRNQIFDADYKNGELLLAYWGKRSFEIIDNHGKHKTIVQLDEPQVPHWVAYYNNDKLLFSSTMLFNGETPRPNLLLYTSAQENITIWEK